MKEEFFGFYPPTKEEIDEIWKESLIAFDANTLLNLYRYSQGTKDDFIKTITDYSSRIWLPYQAGFEFHNNRISVIKFQEKAYNEICKALDDTYQKLATELNKFKRHPFIDIDTILSQLSKKIDEIKKDLSNQSNEHPDYLKSDETLKQVTELFNGKIGTDFTEEEFEITFNEGKVRYAKDIPPGFSDKIDKIKEGNKSLYGDLIIWKQLVTKAKTTKKTIIFVTDDRKEDWWLKFKGQTIRPREELIKEFYDETGFRILIYHADSFLKFAKEKLNSKVKQASINEVMQVRLDDESQFVKYKKNLYKIAKATSGLTAFHKKDFDKIADYSSGFKKWGEIDLERMGESLSRLSELQKIDFDKIADYSSGFKKWEKIDFDRIAENLSGLEELQKIDFDKIAEANSSIPIVHKLDEVSKPTESPKKIDKTKPSKSNDKIK